MRHSQTARVATARVPAAGTLGLVLILAASHLAQASADTPADLPAAIRASGAGAASLTSTAGVASSKAVDCTPDMVKLPPIHPGEASAATGVTSYGWATGWVKDGRSPRRAVLWTRRQKMSYSPIELGLGGQLFPSGRTIDAVPVDINVDGVIAIQVTGHRTRDAGYIWDTTSQPLLRLQGTRSRPEVVVRALNSHAYSAGSIEGPRAASRAAVWRNGKLTVLPHPRGWAASYAVDIARGGWVVGSVSDGNFLNPRVRPWWWRIGGTKEGRNGPLNTRQGGRNHIGSADLIDNTGRILGNFGYLGPIVTWDDHSARPVRYLPRVGRLRALDLHHTGYAVGVRDRPLPVGGANTGTQVVADTGTQAWIARLSDTHVDASATVLPDPSSANPDRELVHTVAWKVAPGNGPLAPDGGMIVAGGAFYDNGYSRALLWTCAESYIGAPPTEQRS